MSTILVLDDDVEFRELVVPGLVERGHVVIEAGTGDEATQRSQGNGVELFIVDGLLPDTDGVTWITKLRNRDQASKVVYVSRLWQDDQSFAHRLLFNDLMVSLVLHKPIVPIEFWEQIDRLLLMPAKRTMSDRSKSLTAGYAKRLPEKLEQLAVAIRTIALGGENKTGALASLIFVSHKLRGTAASFGFPEVGLAAGEIEDIGREMQNGSESANSIALLEVALAQATEASLKPKMPEGTESAANPDGKITRANRNVIVSATKLSDAHEISSSKCNLVATQASELEVISQNSDIPSLLIDLRSIPGDTAFDIAKKVRMLQNDDSPVIGILTDLSITPASALFLGASVIVYSLFESQYAPATGNDFAAGLEQLNDWNFDGKPKVLLVDDDSEFCLHIENILLPLGMNVSIVNEAEEVLSAIEKFKPTLLLLDVSLSSTTSGFDLCSAIRQDSQWHHLPIIFLTARVEIESRLAALQAGGDDFLSKPIIEDELIARVKRAIQTERAIQQRWQNDSLTGLKLRSTFLENARELMRARPSSSGSVLCLIRINGLDLLDSESTSSLRDSIFADLGWILRYRFRVEDLRGIWSDDKLVLLMPGIDGNTASLAMDLLKEEFRLQVMLRFNSVDPALALCASIEPEQPISLTVTIASSPDDGTSIEELLTAADTRLL